MYDRVKRQRDYHHRRADALQHRLRAITAQAAAIPPAGVAEVDTAHPFSFFDGRAVSVHMRDTIVDLFTSGAPLVQTVPMILKVLDGLGIAHPRRIPNSYHLTVRVLVERSEMERRMLALDLASSTMCFGWRWDSTTNYSARSFYAASICFISEDGDPVQVIWQSMLALFLFPFHPLRRGTLWYHDRLLRACKTCSLARAARQWRMPVLGGLKRPGHCRQHLALHPISRPTCA
jgi:hypothetical protein